MQGAAQKPIYNMLSYQFFVRNIPYPVADEEMEVNYISRQWPPASFYAPPIIEVITIEVRTPIPISMHPLFRLLDKHSCILRSDYPFRHISNLKKEYDWALEQCSTYHSALAAHNEQMDLISRRFSQTMWVERTKPKKKEQAPPDQEAEASKLPALQESRFIKDIIERVFDQEPQSPPR